MHYLLSFLFSSTEKGKDMMRSVVRKKEKNRAGGRVIENGINQWFVRSWPIFIKNFHLGIYVLY